MYSMRSVKIKHPVYGMTTRFFLEGWGQGSREGPKPTPLASDADGLAYGSCAVVIVLDAPGRAGIYGMFGS